MLNRDVRQLVSQESNGKRLCLFSGTATRMNVSEWRVHIIGDYVPSLDIISTDPWKDMLNSHSEWLQAVQKREMANNIIRSIT